MASFLRSISSTRQRFNPVEYQISVGRDITSSAIEAKSVTWDELVKGLTNHRQRGVKGGSYIIGGHYSAPERLEAKLVSRSLLTIDVDDAGLTWDDLEFRVTFGLRYAYVAYTTFSHTPEHPKIRLVIPLSRPVTLGEYRDVSRAFVAEWGVKVDTCSFIPNQLMFMPHAPDPALAWSDAAGGDPYPVPSRDDQAASSDAGDGDSDLERMVANQPLDLSDDMVDAYLSAYDPAALEYGEWLEVGIALHHQYQGEIVTGYRRWLHWSARSAKHDAKGMPARWRSFGRESPSRRLTFASVIHRIKDSGQAVAVERGGDGDAGGDDAGDDARDTVNTAQVVEAAAFERLARDAAAVDSVAAYDAYKARVQRMTLGVLPLDKRAMLAREVYEAWGKNEGLTRTDIKREMKPVKRHEGVVAVSARPVWARDWVYIQTTCEFYNVALHYPVKREAFDATYGREAECAVAEMQASRLALNDYRIDTVVDVMFWPGAGMIYNHDGRRMLNSYHDSGVRPCDVIDADGQSVIDMVLAHVRFTLDDVAEQRLLIDFMAWVVQHPGEKINWSIVLQGAQGTGKSFFGAVMMLVLGTNARNIEPSALSGRFTGWAHGATLVIVEEIRVVSENRFEIIDRLKPFIANATISIEEKGRDHRTVPNFTSYLMFTNHKDALPLGSGDRRYAPLFSRVQSEQQLFDELGGVDGAGDYFSKLFGESERRADALSRWLRDWQISDGFRAKGRAPHTRARDSMMALGVSPERSQIEDAIEKHCCAAISDQVLDVTWLNRLCEGEGDILPKTRAITAILLDMGYEQVKDRRIKIRKTGAYHYVWHRDCDDDTARVIVRNYHLGPYHGEAGEDVPF